MTRRSIGEVIRRGHKMPKTAVTSCRLRELREAAGLTAKALGEKCLLKGSRISVIESRLPDVGVSTAIVIAKALGVKVEDIWTAALEFDNE